MYDWWRSQTWDIATHAGFVTYTHHNASGLDTFIFTRSGTKIWTIIRIQPECEPKTIAQLFKIYDRLLAEPATIPAEMEAATVVLEEGQVLYV